MAATGVPPAVFGGEGFGRRPKTAGETPALPEEPGCSVLIYFAKTTFREELRFEGGVLLDGAGDAKADFVIVIGRPPLPVVGGAFVVDVVSVDCTDRASVIHQRNWKCQCPIVRSCAR